MASAHSFLKAKVADGKITIESNNSFCHNIVFVGCSEPTSLTSGSTTPSLVIFPKLEEGKEGLLVMRKPKDSPGTFEANWPLRITVKDGKPWLHLKDEEGLWSCASEERIGGIVDSHIEVCIDGKWYRSDVAQNGKDCIPDPDLICRYLVGKADKGQLLKVIQEADEEKSAKQELYAARRRIQELERQCEELEEANRSSQEEEEDA